MSATQIQNAQPGEDLLGIAPPLEEQVNAGWLHRLHLFNGRALTAAALQSEQAYRAGRLAILGQSVTQGVVKGLALSANLTAADPVLQVASGYGISASGEDVALSRTLRSTLGSLVVIDPATSLVIDTFPNYSKNTSHTAFAGVLLLQPITGQVSGSSVDTGPVNQIVSGNLNASCDQDPSEDAFADWQIVDGVRLVMVAWPPSLGAVPASTDPAFRNRLVYTIFNAEMALTPDDRLPWDMLGVPVALVGFDSTWKAQFVDCAAVVRTGGLRRNRYVLPAQPGAAGSFLLAEPALAQARVSQLTEQLSATPGLTSLVPAFASLPPCGVLPARSMDFTKHAGLWFPSNWTLTVGPVHQEEIETALLAGMTEQPLDPTQNESVEVLLPLPDTLYDPDILITETVDPAFQQAVTNAQEDLTFVLEHRQTIQQEANALSRALNGDRQLPPYRELAGLTQVEIAQLGPALKVGQHSITAVFTGLNGATSTSAPLSQTVSSLSLSSSANPLSAGQTLTLTAKVSPPSATGSIQFSDGATQLGTPVPIIGGVATLVPPALTPGTHAITAMYPGDTNNPASISPVMLQTVSPTPTNVALKPTATSLAAGQAATFIVSVSPSTSTGSVQLLDGGTALSTAMVGAGASVFSTSSLTPGTHIITATYIDSTGKPAANSGAVLVRISQAASTVTLSSSPSPSVLGQSVTFTAVVSPSSATGVVQFLNGGIPLGAAVEVSAGVATLDVFESVGTVPVPGGYISQDYQKLITDAANPPYTLFQDGNGTPLSPPLPLFSSDDMNDLAENGIPHFISMINAKIAKANDLLDLAFLTAQSDIYRFRQYVLGTSDATALAVSPIAAQIAQGESAAVTASNLQSYLSTILPANSPNVPPATTTPKPGAPPPAAPAATVMTATAFRPMIGIVRPMQATSATNVARQFSVPARPLGTVAQPAPQATTFRATTLVLPTAARISPTAVSSTLVTAPGTVAHPASTNDVLAQSPLVGAQLNLRTLTIAQRMSNPPSQEGLFYAVGNRVAFLQLLADLEITIDDLPILVDQPPPPAAATPATTPPPPLRFTIADIRATADPVRSAAAFGAVQTPNINTPGTEADEAALFSTGIHVLEQHTALLRAIEGRIQQYSDFVSECATAQSNIQGFLPQAQTLLTQLENDLAQARQDVAFTTALLNDETARVAGVNATRTFTLQNYVPSVVYTRPRTLQTAADVPSRQLVPGNIASPVPSCLQQSVAIPPELREMVTLLRDYVMSRR